MQTRAVGQRGGYCYCPTQPPLIVNTNNSFFGISTPHSPLILQLNPSRKLGMFSVGDGAPSEKRKARYCVGPGAAAYDWKCPSRARSEAPPAHYVALCGALWCSVVPEPTLLCRRLPPSMPLCVQWNLQAFCRNWLWNSLRIIAYKTEGQMEYLYTAQVEIRHCLWIDFHLREVKRALWLRRNSVKVWSCSCVPNSSLWGATKQPAQPAQLAQQCCTDLPIYRCKQELNL